MNKVLRFLNQIPCKSFITIGKLKVPLLNTKQPCESKSLNSFCLGNNMLIFFLDQERQILSLLVERLVHKASKNAFSHWSKCCCSDELLPRWLWVCIQAVYIASFCHQIKRLLHSTISFFDPEG